MAPSSKARVNVFGGGPAGLMAADVISGAGVRVTVYERMPSVARKVLMAGRGGLNLTHSEPLADFPGRYGNAEAWIAGAIEAFPPEALRAMADGLGQETFVGSSGRVFPRAMKASPLLRSWLARLASQGVTIKTRNTLVGFDSAGRAIVEDGGGASEIAAADATVLALGGASWPRLGSNGAWTRIVEGLGIRVLPLVAANVGVEIGWSDAFRTRFAGEPLKRIAVSLGERRLKGEAIVTAKGLEGGLIYAFTPALRAALATGEAAAIEIDLRPDLSLEALSRRLAAPRGKQSVSTWLRKSVHLAPVAIGLLREATGNVIPTEPEALARAIKEARVAVTGLGGIARAISSAGGIALDEVGPDMMLRKRPGVFVAGEMLDWEAPTGGYLLQGCFATGHAAGRGVIAYLDRQSSADEDPPTPVDALTSRVLTIDGEP